MSANPASAQSEAALMAEDALLGSILLDGEVVTRVAETLRPEHFSREKSAQIYQAALNLCREGEPIDNTTVTAELETMGVLEQVGGRAHLALLCDGPGAPPVTANAEHYARLIQQAAVRRAAVTASGELEAAAADSRTDLATWAQRARQLAENVEGELLLATPEHSPSTWRPIDLAAAMDGEDTALEPSIFPRDDGVCLLYPGRVNSFVGEPEVGKSWAAQLATAQVLSAGGAVLYVDVEKSPRDMVTHLMALGVKAQTMAERLLYVRPEEPFSDEARSHLLSSIAGRTLALTVLDSVEAAMTASGLDPNLRKDYGGWHQRLVLQLQRRTAGPLVLVDHPIKDREKRGDWASGAGNKKALIDGAMLTFELISPFGRGQTGSARLIISKDSPGALRRQAPDGKAIAVFKLTEADGKVTAELLAPGASAGAAATPKPFRPTNLMERVSRYIEDRERPLSQNAILKEVTGKRDGLIVAIRVLVDEGYLHKEPGRGEGFVYRSAAPYREAEDPLTTPTVPPFPDPSPTLPRPFPGER